MPARPGLDRERVVNAAIELLDEAGLDGLTTRRLAARLGVQSPALYWYVRNKDELLDLVAEAICGEGLGFEPDPDLSWREQFQAGLWEFRRLLLSHRDVPRLLAQRPPTGPNRLRLADNTVRDLLNAGFSDEDAAGLALFLTNYVVGLVSEERGTADRAASETGQQDTADEFDQQLAARMSDFPSLVRVARHFGRLQPEALFQLGLDILLDGIESRLAKAAR